MKKLAKEQVNAVLGRLDSLADAVQKQASMFGLTPEQAKRVALHLDAASDGLEAGFYGRASLETRKAEVIQRDPDEPFMDNFDKPAEPMLVPPGMPYVEEAFDDDQTSSVSDIVAGTEPNPFK